MAIVARLLQLSLIPTATALPHPGCYSSPSSRLLQFSLIPVALHTVVISLLNKGFRAIARILTDFENHRTQACSKLLCVVRSTYPAKNEYVVTATSVSSNQAHACTRTSYPHTHTFKCVAFLLTFSSPRSHGDLARTAISRRLIHR